MVDVSFLAEIDLFKDLSDSCLEALEKDSHILDCGAGHLFYGAEHTGRDLFVLEKGSIRTFRACGDRKLTITVLHGPAIFGEMGCFGQGKYHSSAEALQPSRVRIISRERVLALLECAPQVSHELFDLMSERWLHVLHKMETLARKGLIPRLAALLLETSDSDVVAGLTHKELAAHLGAHRESITAALGELRKAGIIAIERKRIRILRRDRLQHATEE
jgi:CRP/FNR family cyclic AMP-dependent transcriptional regulator